MPNLSAHDFSKYTEGKPPSDGYPFSGDRATISAGLRKMVDMVEQGNFLVQHVIVNGRLKDDDFLTTRIVITGVEKRLP